MSWPELQLPMTMAFFAFGCWVGTGVRGAVAEAVAGEVADAGDAGHIGLARVACGLDNVAWVQRPGLGGAVGEAACEVDGPLVSGGVPGG